MASLTARVRMTPARACGLLPTRNMPRKKIASARRSRARSAVLLIDFMNPLDFDGAKSLGPHAMKAASRASQLAKRMRERGGPVIYANDNFGNRTSRQSLPIANDAVAHRRRWRSFSRPRAAIGPFLKPRHSAFFGTPLDFLLDELEVSRLVLCGIAADSCVMFTAHDAYLRQYALWIPAIASPPRRCVTVRCARLYGARDEGRDEAAPRLSDAIV